MYLFSFKNNTAGVGLNAMVAFPCLLPCEGEHEHVSIEENNRKREDQRREEKR